MVQSIFNKSRFFTFQAKVLIFHKKLWNKLSSETPSVIDTDSQSQISTCDLEGVNEECSTSIAPSDAETEDTEVVIAGETFQRTSTDNIDGQSKKAAIPSQYKTGQLPTYDEALKMESSTPNQLRRRISSRLSSLRSRLSSTRSQLSSNSIISEDFKSAQDQGSIDLDS